MPAYLLPGFALEGQYSRHAEQVDVLTPQERTQSSLIEDLERRGEACRDERRRAEEQLQADHDRRYVEIASEYARGLAGLRQRLADEERRGRPRTR